ncbi:MULTISPECIES: hypothetical protein [Burkholderia]|uniref:hypothetical protein n=1 Tax=Burkholderia TaxID=32008 RepID=UPI0013785E9F|nr:MULTISPECIES: hypothetical protein [Burkholderia]
MQRELTDVETVRANPRPVARRLDRRAARGVKPAMLADRHRTDGRPRIVPVERHARGILERICAMAAGRPDFESIARGHVQSRKSLDIDMRFAHVAPDIRRFCDEIGTLDFDLNQFGRAFADRYPSRRDVQRSRMAGAPSRQK